MVRLRVNITSRETIKPSSPTPSHLRFMPLSIADQLSPEIYIQVVLFFPASSAAAPPDTATILKESLSKSLALFYPLAGRPSGDVLREHAHVDCNDKGAEFFEAAAAADGPLDAILRRPSMRELYDLMPNGGANPEPGDPLVVAQLTAFPCGGVALSVCISHLVADAASAAMFLNKWGEIARCGEAITSAPRIHAASVFPPANLPRPQPYQMADDLIPKRFVIREPEIQALRQQSAACGRADPPTRVEAVTAFLWRCVARARPPAAAAAADENRPQKRAYRALINVDLRKRMRSELADASFGNLVVWAVVTDEVSGEGAEKDRRPPLEQAIRGAVTRVDGHYARERFGKFLQPPEQDGAEEDGGVDVMEFSSWCRLPFYRTDFGWGEPAWYCPLVRGLVNVAVLADARDGRGVEAWVWLPAADMERLLEDPQLPEFVDLTLTG